MKAKRFLQPPHSPGGRQGTALTALMGTTSASFGRLWDSSYRQGTGLSAKESKRRQGYGCKGAAWGLQCG